MITKDNFQKGNVKKYKIICSNTNFLPFFFIAIYIELCADTDIFMTLA